MFNQTHAKSILQLWCKFVPAFKIIPSTGVIIYIYIITGKTLRILESFHQQVYSLVFYVSPTVALPFLPSGNGGATEADLRLFGWPKMKKICLISIYMGYMIYIHIYHYTCIYIYIQCVCSIQYWYYVYGTNLSLLLFLMNMIRLVIWRTYIYLYECLVINRRFHCCKRACLQSARTPFRYSIKLQTMFIIVQYMYKRPTNCIEIVVICIITLIVKIFEGIPVH